MPSFESPIGGKKFVGPAMKEFDIPDESQFQDEADLHEAIKRRTAPALNVGALNDFQARMQAEQERDPADIEREIKAAKEARRTGKERLTDGAKRRIEILVGMTRGSCSAEIGGNIFILQTLKSKEMREALTAASEFDGTIQSPFEIRRQLLARSLSQIASVEVDQFVGSTSLEARLDLIDNLDESLLNRLYDEYLKMVKEYKDKYAIKDEASAKEVVEDLKK